MADKALTTARSMRYRRSEKGRQTYLRRLAKRGELRGWPRKNKEPVQRKWKLPVCRYSKPKRHKLTQKLAYYGWRCRYCGIAFSDSVALTWDHAIPLSRGGTDVIANLLPCCKPCNGRKYNRTFAEFMGLVPGQTVFLAPLSRCGAHSKIYCLLLE